MATSALDGIAARIERVAEMLFRIGKAGDANVLRADATDLRAHRCVVDEPDAPDHIDQGSIAARFDVAAGREGAARVRWDENRALTLLHDDPTDVFDLLDAAVELLAHPDDPGYRDVLAVRVAEIVPEALP